jgi:hypothetical protein
VIRQSRAEALALESREKPMQESLTGPFQEIELSEFPEKWLFLSTVVLLECDAIYRGKRKSPSDAPTPMRSGIYSIDLIGMRQLRT